MPRRLFVADPSSMDVMKRNSVSARIEDLEPDTGPKHSRSAVRTQHQGRTDFCRTLYQSS
jgi:hypothetical protein